MMRILLTGAHGFIGRNIAERFSGVHEIFSPKPSELNFTKADAVYEFLKMHPVDFVIHAAVVLDGIDILQTNLKMFFNLVRARQFFGRMIMFGSGAEYDKQYPIMKVNEADFGKRVPNDEYGFYKYICAHYAEEVDFITYLRLFAVFGKYEKYKIRFISCAICRALLGLPIVINQNVIFDYLSVEDFVQILAIFLEKIPTDTCVNVGYGIGIDLKTIAEIVIQEVGCVVPIIISNPGYGKEYTCDITRLRQQIGDFPFEPIEKSIRKLVSYYRHELPKIY